MARLIQKSGYIQGGRAARYMEYVAKRDGVEVLQSTEPVTKKQMQFLTKLLKDFPDAKELFEYADYLQTPNRGTASAFIVAALDTHLHELESESGYMAYIANRPRAEKRGGHGLFSAEDVTDLKAAKSELETHAGKVWTFIFSLRREDAERLGYSSRMAEPIEAGEPLHCGGHAYSTGEVSLVCGISRRGTPSAHTHDGVVGRSQGGVSNAEGDRIDSVQDDERNFSGRDDGALHSEGCRLQGEYTNRQGIVTRAHSGVGNRCRR